MVTSNKYSLLAAIVLPFPTSSLLGGVGLAAPVEIALRHPYLFHQHPYHRLVPPRWGAMAGSPTSWAYALFHCLSSCFLQEIFSVRRYLFSILNLIHSEDGTFNRSGRYLVVMHCFIRKCGRGCLGQESCCGTNGPARNVGVPRMLHRSGTQDVDGLVIREHHGHDGRVVY